MTSAPSYTLRAIVEDGYAMFSKYRLRGPLNVCRCPSCVSDADELALRTTPLREISAPLLAEYTNSAHGYGGDEFLHFLPRYFELLAQGETPSHIGRESCLRRLGETECRNTLGGEEAALCESFFEALLHDVRSEVTYQTWPVGRVACDMRDYVDMVAIAGGDMQRMLDAWDRDTRPTATLHLAAIIRSVGFAHLYSREAFWPWTDYAPVAEQLFQAWLEREETATRIEIMFLETDVRDEITTLERAIDVLQELKRGRELEAGRH